MTTTEQMHLNLGIDLGISADKVARLREKLGTKAKQEKNFKFYSLYGHICNMNVLKEAWKKVKKNDGSPGIDGVSIDSFDKEPGVDGINLNSFDNEGKVMKFLTEIQTELQNKTYKPLPIKRVYIPKTNGKLRPLGIPCVRDRVVQAAVCLILEPIFEADFLDCSYGFRPDKSQHQALKAIQQAMKAGMTSAYDADLKGYFDSIPHDKLIECIKMRVVDNNVLNLIRMWLKSTVYEKDEDNKRNKISHPKSGTPQGGVISPLLSNIYLHWFDKAFHKTKSATIGIAKLIRFADDFVILANNIGANCCRFVEEKIEDWMGLIINKDKTKIVDLKKGDELNFLGYVFKLHKDLFNREKKYLHMGPSEKTIKNEMEKIREMTSKKYCYLPIHEMIDKINEHLRGWKEYFSLGYPKMAYRKINWYVEESVQNNLIKRSQRRYKLPKGVSFYKHLQELGLKPL